MDERECKPASKHWPLEHKLQEGRCSLFMTASRVTKCSRGEYVFARS